MKKGKRMIAGCLLVSMAVVNVTGTALAAAPKPEVDETMYVNLDYYGEKEKVNVVKHYRLNGATQIEDYGDYEKVTNMVNQVVPIQEAGKVTWNFEEPLDSFYYEAAMKTESIELPWNLDVEYKYNGKPATPQELAGKAGMMTIHINAIPNEKAKEYEQNNMLLAIVIPVDTSVCYSVDAPGAQIQSIGDTSLVVFTALPGEDGDFTVTVGSDCFELMGIMGVMIPGTTSSLNYIKDISELKDTWKDEGDVLYDSLHTLLLQTESLKTQLAQMKSGVESLNQAREGVAQAKDGWHTDSNQALAELNELVLQIDTTAAHLQTGKDLLEDMKANLGELADSMTDTQDTLDTLYTRIDKLQQHLEELSGLLVSHGPNMDQITQAAIQAEKCLTELEECLKDLAGKYDEIHQNIQDIIQNKKEYDKASNKVKKIHRATPDDAWDPEDGFEDMEGEIQDWLNQQGALDDIVQQSEDFDKLLGKIQQTAEAWSKEIHKILKNLQAASSLQDQVFLVAKDSDKVVNTTRELLDQGVTLLDDLVNINDTLDYYYPELQKSLDNIQNLSYQLSDATGAAHQFLSNVNNTVQTISPQLEKGSKESMDALIGLLDQGMQMLDSVGGVRIASEQIKGTLDEKIDKLEDTNILKMDPEAEKLSFTSDKNEEPSTIQIVLRTEEISAEDAEDVIEDLEVQTKKESGFSRMWKVLVKMWESIVQIFKDR